MTTLKSFTPWLTSLVFLFGSLEASPEWMEIMVGLVILISVKIVNRTNCLILLGINTMLLSTLVQINGDNTQDFGLSFILFLYY